MPFLPRFDKMLYRLILVFIILALCIGSAGYLYYAAQKQQITRNMQDEISAIADLKVNQIAAWRKERLSDARVISKNTLMASVVRQVLQNPGPSGAEHEVLQWMKSFQEYSDYKVILLTDPQGTVRLSTSPENMTIGPHAIQLIREALQRNEAFLSDFHISPAANYPHLDLVVPLMIHRGKEAIPVGAILIRLNPEEFLYPRIQSWPGASRTAETILIRRDGDQIVFLNQLRHRKDAPLTYRVPYDEKKLLPLAMAMQGHLGVYEAIDYRKVPVLATVRPVPETNWFLVSKVDINEIYAPIRKQAWLTLVVISILMTVSGLSIIFWWRQKSAEHARKQYELELERQNMSSRYNFLSKYANDSILLIDPAGKILEANDRAVAVYGYSHDELLQMNIRDLRPPETMNEIDSQMQKVQEHGGLIFETVHKRKDGSTFPVEVSSRVIELEKKNFYQSVIRDISERKQAEIALINEKNRSNAIIAAIGDGITIHDRDFRIIYQNQVHKDTLGDHKGEYCYQAYQQQDSVCDACLMAGAFLDGKIHRAVRTIRGAQGKLSLEITASPLRNETGEITAGIEVVRNITARVQAETSLKERNSFIEAVMDNMPIGLAVNNVKDGKLIYINSSFEDIYGWPKQSLTGVEEFFTNIYPDPYYREKIKEKILSDIASGDPSRMRWENIQITTNTGKKKIVTAINIPLFEQGIMISTVQDVTAHKQSEDRLTRLNECFLHFGPDPNENINRLVALCGQQLEAACALYNRLDGDILHALGQWNAPSDFNPRDKPEGHICYDVIKEGGSDVCVIRDLPVTSYAQTDPNVSRYGLKTYIGKAVSFGGNFVGSLCVVYQNDRLPSDDELKFLGIVAAAVGVEENRKGTIKALVESENRYKHLIESVTDYIYTVEVKNGQAVSTFHGTGCVAVTGYTSEEYHADPELWRRMIVEEDRDLVISLSKKILTGVPIPPFEHRIIHKDGSLHWVRNTQVPRYDNEGRMIAYDGLITDITKLKMLENQLRQAQKMEAVGQLSGGIAHDFNNILTAIIGYANLLLMKMSKDDELGHSYVEQILSSSERAAHLTHSLLAFSRKQIIDLRPVNLNDIIKRVEKLLVRVIGEDIAFKTRFAAADLPILADSVHIEQVFMNLSTNARDAMPDGGTLLIEAKPVDLREEFVRTHTFFKPGRYACISVTDTGIGMDEITKNRIFEPFFTTKDVGKGTGLGLSMVYGIIKQHKGYIMVSSELGKGTTFEIYLPLITTVVEKQKPKEPAVIERGTETVLIAEDDAAVRDLTRNILEDFGYKVIEAVNGEEAVQMFTRNRDVINILVFDIIMPKKNGKEAYLEIKKMRPDIKALFVSGYTADIIHQKGILDTGLDFIVKPIAPSDFLKKVRDVLKKKPVMP